MAKGNKGGKQGLQLIGTVGDDHLVGDAGNDVIDGGLGFDVIDFSGSSKSVKVNLAAGTASGQGNDTLVSIEDVIGSKRSDSLIGDGFGNILDGGNGNDHLVGNGGDDYLIGGAGNDHLTASSGFDLLDGGAGNDQLAAGDGDNDIFAGAGNDKIVAGSGFDFIDAGDGNDNISSGAGDDEVYAGAGNDKVTGGEGNDWLDGGAGKDNLIGGAGDDSYYVDDAKDQVREMVGEGNDTIVTNSSYSLAKLGNVENLTLDGSANVDATGNSADNVLTGNSGDNVLAGQAGNDILIGGEGDDTLIGGTGNDIFVFDNLDGVDGVQDFTIGSDLLGLDAEVFTALAAGVLDANLVMGAAAVDADDFLIFDATSGALSYDADANGIGAAVQIATVGVPSLVAADFVVA